MTVPYLNLWTLAWNHQWLQGRTDSYWDANQFFPHQKTLAYSEPQLGTALLTFPVVLFGGNTVLAYNLALLLFFFGAGMAVYALCWWLLGLVGEIRQIERCIASITVGILYAFTPYMFRELGVLQLLAAPFPPLCLLGLHRFFYQKRFFDALLFTAGFLGCWYTCAYYGLFLSIFVFCFTIIFWHPSLFHKQFLHRGLITVIILIGGLLPLANGMRAAKNALALDWTKEIVHELSGIFIEYLRPSSSSLFYKLIFGVEIQGSSLFLGGMLVCLASLGAIIIFRGAFPVNDQPHPPLQRCGIFYIAMACVAFILSLGMTFAPIYTQGLGAYQFLVWISPYNLLYKFMPGFSSIRSPYRFSIFLVLFLAILAGIGMLWIGRSIRSRWRWVLIVSLMAITIFELWPTPLRLIRVPGKLEELPHIYQHIKKLPSDAVLIEFPLSTVPSEEGLEATARYMYFSTFYWYRLVNGYSGFAPRASRELINVLTKSHAKIASSALKTFGVQYVVAHWNNMTAAEKTLLETLAVDGHLKPLFHEGADHTLYQIDDATSKAFKTRIPNVKRLVIYESKEHARSVTLGFNYQMDTDDFLLITPWQNSIECEVSWYKDLRDRTPVYEKKVRYRGSRLVHAKANAIAIDVPAPAPGKYRVVVKHSLSSTSETKTGICEIYPHGFVQFREEL